MNIIIVAAIVIGCLFLIIPATFVVIAYFKSFNKKSIVIREVGEDPNDGIISLVKSKTSHKESLGSVIIFFPLSGFKITKRFASQFWTKIHEKNKVKECIVLYNKGDNYNPVSLVKRDDGYVLSVKYDSNAGFLMDKIIHKHNHVADNKVYLISIIVFFAFLMFVTITSLGVIAYMMDTNMHNYILSQGFIYG